MNAEVDARVGTILAGRYQLDRLLGRGGYGDVYAGVHVGTRRAVAVKVLRTEHHSASVMQRFLREARIVGEVEHPNMVDILDIGENADGVAYLVFELLRGESLAEKLMLERRLDPSTAIETAAPILDALAALHDRGVVHRDVKPDNIFMSRDALGAVVPKLLDLGISKDAAQDLTADNAVLGTPRYMSPEQVRASARVTPAADIWSMGVVLYECLSGEAPFDATNHMALMVRIQTEDPKPLRAVAPEIPSALAEVVDRSLRREISERPLSARAFRDELLAIALREGWQGRPIAGARRIATISGDDSTMLATPVSGRREAVLADPAPVTPKAAVSKDASSPVSTPAPNVVGEAEAPGITPAATPVPPPSRGGRALMVAALLVAPLVALGTWAWLRPAPSVAPAERRRPAEPVPASVEVGADLELGTPRSERTSIAAPRASETVDGSGRSEGADEEEVAPAVAPSASTEPARGPRERRPRIDTVRDDPPPPPDVPLGNHGAPIIRD